MRSAASTSPPAPCRPPALPAALAALLVLSAAAAAPVRAATVTDAYGDLQATISAPDTALPGIDFTVDVEGIIAGGGPSAYGLYLDADWTYDAGHRVVRTGGTTVDERAFNFGDHRQGYVVSHGPGTYRYLYVFGWRSGGHDWYDLAVELAVVVRDDGCPFAAAPSEIPHLAVTRTKLEWTLVPNATHHDVVRGDLGSLHASGGDFSVALEECLADDLDGLSLPRVEPPGPDCFYLVRAVNCAGAGTWDSGGPMQVESRDPEAAASDVTCP